MGFCAVFVFFFVFFSSEKACLSDSVSEKIFSKESLLGEGIPAVPYPELVEALWIDSDLDVNPSGFGIVVKHMQRPHPAGFRPLSFPMLATQLISIVKDSLCVFFQIRWLHIFVSEVLLVSSWRM